MTTTPQITPEQERRLAVDLFNGTWDVLRQEARSPDDDARAVHMAHASLAHWLNVGEPVHGARGEWMCSRVYAVIGRSEPALYHARRALDICERNGIGDWDLAFCHEAMARAHAVAGDRGEAQRWMASAREAAADIEDSEDRDLVLADLDTIPA